VEVVERLPTSSEYIALRTAVGWPSLSEEDCDAALQGSLASVCAMEGGAVIGMGRLIGDGRAYCYAVDVVVNPNAQGEGLGSAIMRTLEAIAAERNLSVRLDLVAATDVAPFYERLGYEVLPNQLMRKRL
jgi:GNAT superfamily N-acetyltransferase